MVGRGIVFTATLILWNLVCNSCGGFDLHVPVSNLWVRRALGGGKGVCVILVVALYRMTNTNQGASFFSL